MTKYSALRGDVGRRQYKVYKNTMILAQNPY